MDSATAVLTTPRLELRPITFPQVYAILQGRRRPEIEALIGAELPWAWPMSALVEQVFRASLHEIKRDPESRLWGDRFIITREETPRVVGSIIFHGRPGIDGVCELGFGIEETSQGKGYGSEALPAVVKWAFAQPECHVIRAEASAWHKPATRLLQRVGLRVVGEHEEKGGGKMLVFEIKRPA